MNWAGLFSQVLGITSNLNPQIAITLFFLCLIGEVWIALPYILETIWLLAGYHLAMGTLSISDLLLIWITAQAGRQTGSLILYFSGVLGLPSLTKLFKRYIEPRLPKGQVIPGALARRLANPSVFSIAAARLAGLRIPVALTMSAKKKLPQLTLGVLLSSIIWDAIYLLIGRVVGATIVLDPISMLLYSLGGLTVLYLITLGVRYLLRIRKRGNNPI